MGRSEDKEVGHPDRIQSLGFLGLGSLGAPIARRLALAGPIVAFDPDPARFDGLPAAIERAASPAETGDRADIVFACLAAESHHLEALLGSAGLIRGRRCRIYVHLGTSGSPLLARLAKSMAEAGIETVDAPVTGGPPKARSGELTSIVSGKPECFSAIRGAIDLYSRKVVGIDGPPGRAQTLKLVNNAIALVNLVAACESLVVGAKAGLPIDAMLEVINNGSGQNSATQAKVPAHIVPRSFDFGASLDVVIKDLELFLAEPAANEGAVVDTCRSALQAYRRAKAEGVEIDDLTAVVRPMERRAGAELGTRP
ncbi:NAD(P)-dependent oxidoreductase [Bosea sp. 47.2.35]|jgi:3-hydroxyisobutyrate dehydrogenase-like beta-hydroxyacid dehydrogenase|uniref:NAD(P)-dependent oxidoreductase n=1 Tax=Bosea sp. 47.2.35 TaxID=2969304 RepID=UPI00214F98C0|nr:NAD(P)-dependent oxidoreductase [Bosea sp. 47.2.35]MCR4524181.1 NAD(P)-dependent oxidoreductase [Bosea sp. 47.2.35]